MNPPGPKEEDAILSVNFVSTPEVVVTGLFFYRTGDVQHGYSRISSDCGTCILPPFVKTPNR